MAQWWREQLRQRPWWMNLLMLFCLYMACVFMPWDFFFKPVARDEEVWFGLMLRGWAAKATEPLHWAIYAAGAYGFWRMRSWMWPWAAIYAAQVAVGTLIWSIVYVGGVRGWAGGIAGFVPCAVVAMALWTAREQFGRRRTPLSERYGEWALITGASAGIGAEFARAAASEGMSCVVTARREDRLQALARELEQLYNVRTRVVAVDLCMPDGADRLADAVQDLEISLLVNNAGFGYAGGLAHQDPERLRAMINLNCLAPVILTSRLVPAMRARGRGAVIITGSVAGCQPVPFNGVYSATKAFDRFFGESLWCELLGSGIDVLVLEPGPTETEFQTVAGETAHPGEPPAQVVAVALDALGRQPSVVSGWFNWMQSTAGRLVPRSFVTLLAGRVMSRWVPAAAE